MKKEFLYALALLLVVISCNKTIKPDANTIIAQAMTAHGSNKVTHSTTAFKFRGTDYSVTRDGGLITYTRSMLQEQDTIKDVKNNNGITRYRNDILETVSDSLQKKHDAALNSVIYFAQLPYSLDGPAVIKKHLGNTTIKGKKYHKIEVTFKADGGGEDYEDVFIYWVNEQSYLIDYLAYSYCELVCGVRFRESINRTDHSGIIMQDYKNYQPIVQDPKLEALDELFENGKLELLSEIINTDVRVVVH